MIAWPVPRAALEVTRRRHPGDRRQRPTLVPMDLTDMPAIDRLGAGAINERWGKLDLLVANAGVLARFPIGHVEGQGVREGHERQRHSHLAGDPLGRAAAAKSDAGRALILSSGVAHSARAFWGPLTPPPRPRWKPWPGSGRPRPTKTRLKIKLHRPGRCPHRDAGPGDAGREPRHPPHPSEVAAKLVPLCRTLTAPSPASCSAWQKTRSSTTAFPNTQAGPRPTI